MTRLHNFGLQASYTYSCAPSFESSVLDSLVTTAGMGRADLNGKHLTVATILNPLAKIANSSYLATPGLMEVACLDLLTKTLNFTYEVVVPSMLEVGRPLRNGSWTGALGMVQRKEVDMGISLSPPSWAKNQVMESSYFVYDEDTGIVIPYPSQADKVWILMAPFRKEVWICWILVCIVTPLAVWINGGRGFSAGYLIHSFFLNLEMTLSRRASHGNRKFLSYRMICGCILLTAVVLSVAYPAVYTAQLSVPRYRALANSIEDVAANPAIKVYMTRGSATITYVEESTGGALKIIGDKLRRHPEKAIGAESFPTDLTDLVKDNHVFIVTASVADNLVQNVYDQYNECRITVAEKTFWKRQQCITFPKNSPLTNPINNQLLRLHEAGLLDHAVRNSKGTSKHTCFIGSKTVNNQHHHEPSMLNFMDFSGSFVILGAGFLLAIVVFCVEVLFISKNISPKKNEETKRTCILVRP